MGRGLASSRKKWPNLPPRANDAWARIPYANGGILLRDLRMPDFRDYAAGVPKPGTRGIGDVHVLGPFLRDVAKLEQRAAKFSRIWPGRDTFERLGSTL